MTREQAKDWIVDKLGDNVKMNSSTRIIEVKRRMYTENAALANPQQMKFDRVFIGRIGSFYWNSTGTFEIVLLMEGIPVFQYDSLDKGFNPQTLIMFDEIQAKFTDASCEMNLQLFGWECFT